MKYAIIAYIAGMVLFWFHGNDSNAWNVYYYGLEKLFTVFAFIMLAKHTENKQVKRLATYAAAICVFMLLYFIYCLFFGHSHWFAFSSFVAYSIFFIFILK